MRFRFALTVVWCPLIFAVAGIAAPAVPPSGGVAAGAVADTRLFDYDRSAPLDLQEHGTVTRDGAVIKDVSFVGAKDRVEAYLVTPVAAAPAHAGILYVHWLGDPETTNRTEFLNEAVAMAGEGVVSLLVNAMWSAPKWYTTRVPEEDFDRSVRQVIDLRRALDLLLAQPGVDPHRLAYVGHDFGAMYGTVMGAVDRRPTTYVLMTGTPHFVDWMLFAQKPKALDEYKRRMATLDPAVFIPQLAPVAVFLQFASRDEFVSAAAANEFYAAARVRKQTAMYDAGHDLKNVEATADRVTWLVRMLGANP